MELHADQERAVAMATRERFCFVTGPPGSGKSTILREIALRLRARGEKALYLTPTGRAAAVVQKSVGAETVCTIAMMRATPEIVRAFRGGVVVVDEASMVSSADGLDGILCELEPRRVVLFGDADQLRPVGGNAPPGGVLAELAAASWIPRVVLTKIFRQNSASALYRNIVRVKEGKPMGLRDLEKDKSFAIDARKDTIKVVEREIDAAIAENRPVPTIICLTNETRVEIGKVVQRKLNAHGRPLPAPYDGTCRGMDRICIGDPVVCRVNVRASKKRKAEMEGKEGKIAKNEVVVDEIALVDDGETVMAADAEGGEEEEATQTYANLINNGSMGTACVENEIPLVRYATVDARGNEAAFDDKFDMRREKFTASYMQCGYVLTVDMSQGGQYETVVAIMDDEKRRPGREHLYVMLSRAEKRCVLVAGEGSVEKATRAPWGSDVVPSQLATLLREYDFSKFVS